MAESRRIERHRHTSVIRKNDLSVQSADIPTPHIGLFAGYGELTWRAQYRAPGNVAGDVVGCYLPLCRTGSIDRLDPIKAEYPQGRK